MIVNLCSLTADFAKSVKREIPEGEILRCLVVTKIRGQFCLQTKAENGRKLFVENEEGTISI